MNPPVPTTTHAVGPETARIELPGGFYAESTGHIHQMGPSFDAWDVFDSSGGYCGEFVDKSAVDAFAAALHARPDGVPDGWQLVPKEATQAIIDQMPNLVCGRHCELEGGDDPKQAWREMLAAAPKSPAPATQGDGWTPISDNTPKDRPIEVYAPSREGLNSIVSLCKWHPDAGFCICEIRHPTHWREHIPPSDRAATQDGGEL